HKNLCANTRPDSQLRRSDRTCKYYPADDRIDYSPATLDLGTAPLHHNHRQLPARPYRSRALEYHRLRIDQLAFGAAHCGAVDCFGSGQFVDRYGLLRLGFSSQPWAFGFERSCFYQGATYALAARRDRRYREPAFVFSDRLYPGPHALAGPWNPGFDRLVLRGYPRDP